MKELNLNVGLESLNKMNPKVQASNANSNHLSQRLLGNYLKDVEKILRKGESKDDEIDDMIVSVPRMRMQSRASAPEPRCKMHWSRMPIPCSCRYREPGGMLKMH